MGERGGHYQLQCRYLRLSLGGQQSMFIMVGNCVLWHCPFPIREIVL